MAFDSRDLMINLPSAGDAVGYQLTCQPLSPARPGDDKGKPKPNCPPPSCQNSAPAPKPPVKPGPKKGRRNRVAADLLALRQQLRQTLSREL